MKGAIWPLLFLGALAFLLATGVGLPIGQAVDLGLVPGDDSVVGQQATSTPTPVRLYLPFVANEPTATPTPTPTFTPTPTSTPTPTPFPQWTGEYFNNASVSGNPVLTRNDERIDFDWKEGSPDPALPSDGFSVRWTRTLTLEAGDYNFFTYTDDGVRLWVDNVLVIDRWQDQMATQYLVPRSLAAGQHSLRMEYYDRAGGAIARLGWVNTSAYGAMGYWGQWRGEYFDNISLSGNPRMVRKDEKIDFNWGESSPDPSIPSDNFSVRWTASLYLAAGSYNFFTYTDDGVRLYVDGALVIDEWHDQGRIQWRSNLYLADGTHFIRMEYYDRGGEASASLWWHNGDAYAQWRGEYFSNTSLSGVPVFARNDANIDFVWPDSPGSGVPADRFSVRWTRILNLEEGTYTFKTLTDDGVRLWVDGFQGLNEWHPQGPTEWMSVLPLGAGVHFIRMEYFEDVLGAQARLTWEKS